MADAPTQPQPASPPNYAVGDVIAEKYRLERVLGEGGQACVWKARNLMLDADVAIKVVRSDARDPSHARRLLQEARSAARLDHPAIVRIFDLGQTATSDLFLVMELLEGQDLADYLYGRERLLPVEAVRMLLPVADALAFAHQKALVHRDIKPENVFLSQSGDGALKPKLLDFGVVKLQKSGEALDQLTESGAVVGTPAYFAPEQARGAESIDERTDVWAFCAMLYECLTGQLPFTGANYNALLRSILEDQPRSILDHGVQEPALWRIVRRGLSKPNHQRWPSMRVLGRALAGWLMDRGVVDDISRSSLQSRWRKDDAPLPALMSSASLPGENAPLIVANDLVERQSPTLPSANDGHVLNASRRGVAPPAWLRRRATLVAFGIGAAIAGGWVVREITTSESVETSPQSAPAPEIVQPPARKALPAREVAGSQTDASAVDLGARPTKDAKIGAGPDEVRVEPGAPAARRVPQLLAAPGASSLRSVKKATPVPSAAAPALVPSVNPAHDDLELLTPY